MNSLLFAPDGMRVGGGVAEVFRSTREACPLMGVVIGHEREDDGLVHGHGWAVRGDGPDKSASGDGAAAGNPVRVLMDVVLPHDRHDDGLVHGHRWAVREA